MMVKTRTHASVLKLPAPDELVSVVPALLVAVWVDVNAKYFSIPAVIGI